jgi:hypothetical protein
MMLINRICAIVLLASLAMGIARSQTFTPARFGSHELSVTDTLRALIDRPPGGFDDRSFMSTPNASWDSVA